MLVCLDDVDYKLDEETGLLLVRKYGMMQKLRTDDVFVADFIQEDKTFEYKVVKQDDKYYYCEFIR